MITTQKITGTLLLFFISLISLAQTGEGRFAFELNGGISQTIQKLGGAETPTGGGFEAVFHYQVLSHWGIYAGWGWNKFATGSSDFGKNIDFEETGYVWGVQFKNNFSNSSTAYFFRAGGSYNHLELENEDGTIIQDTGHGLGWQLAGGLDLPLGSKLSLIPGIKFNALSRELTTNESTSDLNLKYLSLRLGILKKF